MLMLLLVVISQADATPTWGDAPGIFGTMIQSFQDGNWPLAIGSMALLLFLVVLAVNGVIQKMTAIEDEMRKSILAWSAAGGGMALSFGLTLIGGGGWVSAIVTGLIIGTAAAGFWQLVIKSILKRINKPK